MKLQRFFFYIRDKRNIKKGITNTDCIIAIYDLFSHESNSVCSLPKPIVEVNLKVGRISQYIYTEYIHDDLTCKQVYGSLIVEGAAIRITAWPRNRHVVDFVVFKGIDICYLFVLKKESLLLKSWGSNEGKATVVDKLTIC